MTTSSSLKVQVVYAQPERVFVKDCEVPFGSTLWEAVQLCGVLDTHPELSLSGEHVGIFGRVMPADHPLGEGDRVEIYRPLKTESDVAQ